MTRHRLGRTPPVLQELDEQLDQILSSVTAVPVPGSGCGSRNVERRYVLAKLKDGSEAQAPLTADMLLGIGEDEKEKMAEQLRVQGGARDKGRFPGLDVDAVEVPRPPQASQVLQWSSELAKAFAKAWRLRVDNVDFCESVCRCGERLIALRRHTLAYQEADWAAEAKFKVARVTVPGSECPECKGRMKVGGPFHCGPLYDRDFLQRCLQVPAARRRRGDADRREVGRLEVLDLFRRPPLRRCVWVVEDALSEGNKGLAGAGCGSSKATRALYYKLPNLCKSLKVNQMPLRQFRGTLISLGYRVSHFHREPQGEGRREGRQPVASFVERSWPRHMLKPGLATVGFDCCGACISFRSITSRTEQNMVSVSTKTKDNVFVHVKVAVQQSVMPESTQEAMYKLDNVHAQIESYVADVVRSFIPQMTLDESFEKKDPKRGRRWRDGVTPNAEVVASMNEINKQKRLRDASQMAAEAEKIKVVKAAEAQADAAQLQGEGIARQRRAIIDGLRDSITHGSGEQLSTEKISELLLITQYFETLRDVAANNRSSTVFLPSGPGAVGDVSAQIRNGLLTGAAGAPGQLTM
eukprot:g24046.t1